MSENENTDYLEQNEQLRKELEIGLNSELVEYFKRDEFLQTLHEKYLT